MGLLDGSQLVLFHWNDCHLCQPLFNEPGTASAFVLVPVYAYSYLHRGIFQGRLGIYVERRSSGKFGGYLFIIFFLKKSVFP